VFLVDKRAENAQTRGIEALQPLVNGVENGHFVAMRAHDTALALALVALTSSSTAVAQEGAAPPPPSAPAEETPPPPVADAAGNDSERDESEPREGTPSSSETAAAPAPVDAAPVDAAAVETVPLAAPTAAPSGAPSAPPAPAEQSPPPSTTEPVGDEDTSQEFPYDKRRNTPQGTTRPTGDDDDDGAPDEKKKLDADRADFTYKALRLSAGAGYALRLSADERSHGGVGVLSVGLPIFYGFGIAAEGLVMGWGPSEKRTAPLAFGGGSALVTYVFDDTASTAILGVGPLVGYALELEESGALTTGLHAGAVFTFGLRFAVAPTTTAEIGIRAPFMLYGPEGVVVRMPLMQTETDTPGLFESQFLLTFGLTFDPFMFFDLFSQGRDPLPLVVPFLSAAQDG